MTLSIDHSKPFIGIGLMSGTSMDAIDAVAVLFEPSSDINHPNYKIIAHAEQHYSIATKQQLENCISEQQASLKTLGELQVAVATAFATAAKKVMALIENNTAPIAFIASHGQTVYHLPPNEARPLGYSMQLGHGAYIAAQTGITTIADFRINDMAYGGQGAPLVPFADQLLFQHESLSRVIHNLGGISNITVLPSTKSEQTITAFDTGPANSLIDALCQHFFSKPYDKDNSLSTGGAVNTKLLADWLAHPYFKKAPPKSTGKEDFGPNFLNTYLSNPLYSTLSPADWVKTAEQFTVDSIIHAYKTIVFPITHIDEIILGGGGTNNPSLIQQLQHFCSTHNIKLSTHQDYGINNQHKEALAFALLGYARAFNIPANIASCTGAKQAVLLGSLFS